MCSINGFNYKDNALILEMNRLTSYRGPDDTGVFVDNNISLGHNRLSIIDLSKEAGQPMFSFDKKQVIVFNGEIYNYRELKKELKDTYPFKTQSDTEVILAAYRKWGHDCVKKFNGIFALAILDDHKHELFIARDHLGVKPVFYYFDGSKFIFSSEIKAILKHGVKRDLNINALNLYFRFLYINGPETIWQNIYKLPPANYLVLKNNKIDIQQYWQVEDYKDSFSKEQAASKIKETLKAAVKRQMIADVPVGMFLSGGIDSTVILGLMSEFTDKPIKTFSVGFDIDLEQDKFNSDYLLARQTSKYYKTEHHELIIKPQDVLDNMEKVIWHMDDLIANPTQISMFLLSKFTQQEGIKVILGGDGGDELFGGYDRYYYYDLIRKWQKMPKIIRQNTLNKAVFSLLGKEKNYNKLNSASTLEVFWSFRAQKEKMVSRFLNPQISNLQASREYIDNNNFKKQPDDFLKKLMKADIDTWLIDESLAQSDKMSMAWGVEQRVPILDKEVVELAFKIANKYKINSAEQGKLIFKQALKQYIPDFIYNQRKRGWFAPTAKWLRTGMKDMAYEVLSPDYNSETKDLFDFKEIRLILDNHINQKEYALNTVWSLINFQIWYKHYKV